MEIAPSLQNKVNQPLSKSVHVVALDICDIHYSVEGIPETVEVCGAIEIKDDATAAYLNMLVFWMPDKTPISMLATQGESLFENGSFSRDLVINGEGDYLIEVLKGRSVLASIEFTANHR